DSAVVPPGGPCGGMLAAASRARTGPRRKRVFVHGCSAHHKRGPNVFPNAVIPIDRVDRAVLGTLAGDGLSPAIVRAALNAVFDALAPATVSTTVDVIKVE